MSTPCLTRRGLIAGTLASSRIPNVALGAPAGTLRPVTPRVEWRRRPEGVDTPRPRFTWTAEAADPAAQGVRQSAWRIVVATSAAKATAGTGDIWDSGKVSGAGFRSEERRVGQEDVSTGGLRWQP